MDKKESKLRSLADKLFGGIEMTWPRVLVFAVGTTVLTTLFLLLPVFRDTSFERVGVYTEAWVLFAVIIMANCKKPLESALKTFVFFLVSQPLIYLFQVPFSDKGWAIFGYYKYWFILTLLTFPAAFIGWYIKKKNWLSLLILAPVLLLLTSTYVGCFRHAFAHFPDQILAALFCLAQVVIYVYAFTSEKTQKLVGYIFAALAAVAIIFMIPHVDFNETGRALPDDLVLSESATVESLDPDIADVTIARTGEDSAVNIHSTKYGETEIIVHDGGEDHRYTVKSYEDEGGHPHFDVTEQ